LNVDYAPLPWVASLEDTEAETLLPLRSLGPQVTPDRLVLTFDNLLQRTDFVPMLKQTLATLSRYYELPVDVEFAASVRPAQGGGRPQIELHLLQCRPQSSLRNGNVSAMPAHLPARDKLFETTRMVPQGEVKDIEYIIYVDPEAYSKLDSAAKRVEVARRVGSVNKALEGHVLILMGPGRWGSSNIQLGVPVTYADLYNARTLVEISVGNEGLAPDPSYGTHFFQDLVESQIYSLAIHADPPGTGNGTAGAAAATGTPEDFLNWDFLQKSADRLSSVLPDSPAMPSLKVIDIANELGGQRLHLLMDGEKALAYFGDPGA
jgi:hypothetical protein